MKSYQLLLLISLIVSVLSACTDPNCQTCPVDPAICTACVSSYYLNGTSCLSCGGKVTNCLACTYTQPTDSVTCTTCASAYVLNTTGNTCLSCAGVDPKCVSCFIAATTLKCSNCDYGFVLNGSKCQSCQYTIANCSICNDTVLNVSCVNCYTDYWTNIDASQCLLCGDTIGDCL